MLLHQNTKVLFLDNGWICHLRTRDDQVRERADVLHLSVKDQQRPGTEGVGGDGGGGHFLEQNGVLREI